jgi:hypothetical protein
MVTDFGGKGYYLRGGEGACYGCPPMTCGSFQALQLDNLTTSEVKGTLSSGVGKVPPVPRRGTGNFTTLQLEVS